MDCCSSPDHMTLQGWSSMNGWKLTHVLIVHWMVCDVPWAPAIYTGVDTTLNSSMGAYIRLIHHCTKNHVRGSHPYWPHNTPRMVQHFLIVPWMVYDIPWAPTIYTGVGNPLSPSMGTRVRLVYHYIHNQSGGSHPQGLHNTRRMYYGWMDETILLSSFAFYRVWWTTRSNYLCRCWQRSQFINGCMGEVDTHSIQRMSHWWMDEYWHTFILSLVWCVMYHGHPIYIEVLIPLSTHHRMQVDTPLCK